MIQSYYIKTGLDDRPYTPPTVVPVRMNDGKYSPEGLTTRGLNGCIALISRTKNGISHHGIMTHYTPTNTHRHIAKIEELLASYADDLPEGDTKAVLLYPQMGASVDELARKVKKQFERLSHQEGIVSILRV